MASNLSALDKIEELQKQIEHLKQQAIDEVKQKLFDARKLVNSLEEELAGLSGRDALRVRKFIKNNPKMLKRQGSGPGTKFFLQ